MPGHSSIEGKKRGDYLANRGARGIMPDTEAFCVVSRTHINGL